MKIFARYLQPRNPCSEDDLEALNQLLSLRVTLILSDTRSTVLDPSHGGIECVDSRKRTDEEESGMATAPEWPTVAELAGCTVY